MIELRQYQKDMIERVRDELRADRKSIVIVLATGGGKCLRPGTLVMRYDGISTPVETVRVGDLLMGPDSKPRTVLGTTLGHGPMYRVTPVKGEPWECNDEHILSLVRTNDGTPLANSVIDVSVKSYVAQGKTFKHIHKQFAPDRIDFAPGPKLPIDPYFLGVWFGDGTKALNGIGISKPDPEILAICQEMADRYGLKIRTDYGSSGCPTHHITQGQVGASNNPLLTALRNVAGRHPNRIPYAYRVASYEDRMTFLAGILDTDGSLAHGGYDFVQRHRGIVEDVAFIARSVGLSARTPKAKIVNGDEYWRTEIGGHTHRIPMRIERKKAHARMQEKDVLRTGIKVEPIGDGEYAGFELDGDGRFLLADFTVTHNTVVAAQLILSALEKGSRLLFLAHRRELIAQTVAKLIAIGVPESVIGVIMGNGSVIVDGEARRMNRPDARVQVGSIDTVRGRFRHEADRLPFDIIFVDEAHRCLSASYMRVKEWYPNAVHLGLTATPYRGNGKGLGPYYESLVVGAYPSQLVAEGFILEPQCWTVPPDELPDLEGVGTKGGDYDDAELAEACNKRQLVGSIVDHWNKLGGGRRTVCFAVNVEHSRAIVADFVAAGVRAEHLDGTTPGAERDAILGRLSRGDTLIVSNCGVLTEGWDSPPVKCCILARPTRSTGLYLQMAGRILRPWNGVDAVILDHAGNVLTHGMPTEDREFELGNRKKKREDDPNAVKCKTCPKCFAIVLSKVTVCPAIVREANEEGPEEVCGHEWKREAREGEAGGLEIVEGELTQATRETQEEKKAHWAKLCEVAKAEGHRPGWAWHRFKETYGHGPPRSFTAGMGRVMTEAEQANMRARLERMAHMKGIPGAREWAAGKVAKQVAGQEAKAKKEVTKWEL